MPNHRIMLVGTTGTGKSSQICTLKGPKIIYAFDPNTYASVDGYLGDDAKIVELHPTMDEVDLMPASHKTKPTCKKPKMYEDWVTAIKATDFSPYKWLILDSQTFLAEAIMDGTKFLTAGSGDTRADYMYTGGTLHKINRILASLPLNILVMAHYRKVRNETTGRTETEIHLPGKSRDTILSMYTNVFATSVEIDKTTKRPSYFIQTVPDSDHPGCRSTLKNLDPKIDVSIDFNNSDLYSQGIGRLFNS